jgi:hypothetical protein
MIRDLIVVPNFFSNPDNVKSVAQQQPFYNINTHPVDKNTHPVDKNTQIYWGGNRTTELSESNDVNVNLIHNEFETTFLQKVVRSELDKDCKVDLGYNFSSNFHYFTKDYSGGKTELHQDSSLYSGVIYLNDTPLENPENHGTIIFNEYGDSIIIPYEYNKFIMYRADYTHAPLAGFGDTVLNSRLSFVFFIQYFNISIHRNTL